jgi:hypothetical protein
VGHIPQKNARNQYFLANPLLRLLKRVRKTFPLEEKMSPKAIKSLIDMFGVEHGVQILNLFTAPEDDDIQLQASSIRQRPSELIRDVTLPREIPMTK